MTTVSFRQFMFASPDAKCNLLISEKAVKKLYHLRRANILHSDVPGSEYHISLWDNGDAVIRKEIDELRAEEFPDVW